jgi:hypothetical protein
VDGNVFLYYSLLKVLTVSFDCSYCFTNCTKACCIAKLIDLLHERLRCRKRDMSIMLQILEWFVV